MVEYTVITFTTASIFLIISTLIGMLLAKRHDDYSILHQRLSYSGVRKSFIHKRYGIEIPRNTYPEFMNIGFIIPGILYILSFLLLDNLAVIIIGVLFGISVTMVGIFDVGSNYQTHMLSVYATQILFVSLGISIIIISQSLLTIASIIIIVILGIINTYQRKKMSDNYTGQTNVIFQKLFIYIEALYLIFVPSILVF